MFYGLIGTVRYMFMFGPGALSGRKMFFFFPVSILYSTVCILFVP